MREAEKNLVFEDLFKQHFRQLYVHAYGWVHDEEWAKDIVHDAFCRLWENFDRYADQPQLLSLLYTFVRSLSIDHLRHDQARENYLRTREETDEDSREDYAGYEELMSRVMAAIRRFPPQTRRIFIACVLRHKTYKEAAEEFGISPLTVKTLMARALKTLRTQREIFLPWVVLLFAWHYVL